MTDKSENKSQSGTKIQIIANGPILVEAPITIKDAAGNETYYEKTIALCRCGASHNKPFCDGSHRKINFNG
jgi:CDGSH-type Zn-finger protein